MKGPGPGQAAKTGGKEKPGRRSKRPQPDPVGFKKTMETYLRSNTANTFSQVVGGGRPKKGMRDSGSGKNRKPEKSGENTSVRKRRTRLTWSLPPPGPVKRAGSDASRTTGPKTA